MLLEPEAAFACGRAQSAQSLQRADIEELPCKLDAENLMLMDKKTLFGICIKFMDANLETAVLAVRCILDPPMCFCHHLYIQGS